MLPPSRPPKPPKLIKRRRTEDVPPTQPAPLQPLPETEGGQERHVQVLSPLFYTFSQRDHLEIEGKLGKCLPVRVQQGSRVPKFESGVSRDDFNKYHGMLMSFRGWDNVAKLGHWVSSFDYMLDNNVRVTKTSAGNKFVRKTLLQHVTFKCHGRPYDLRVSLKEELPVEIRLPQEPRLVRVKRRKSFIYQGQWQFDMTIVWTGRDEQDAAGQEPTHEVECEFIGDRKSAGPDYAHTARSLMEKLIDFLGRDTPLQLEMVQ